MAELVKKCGVKKEKGFLYFVDKDGDVSCAVASRGNKKGGKPKKVLKTGIKKITGYLYFIDKKGDISCAPMKNSEVAKQIALEKEKKTSKVSKKQTEPKPRKAPKKK